MKHPIFFTRHAWCLLAVPYLCSCITTREVVHQTTLHDTLQTSVHDTLQQWHTHHDSVFVHDSVYWQGSQWVKERVREHWHWRHDTIRVAHADALQHTQHTTTHQREVLRPSSWLSALNALPASLPFLAVLLLVALWRHRH